MSSSVERKSKAYSLFSSIIDNTMDTIKEFNEDIKSKTKELKEKQRMLKKEKDPDKRDTLENEIADCEDYIESVKIRLENANLVLENRKKHLAEREKAIVEADPSVKDYIEYSKARKYYDKIEKDTRKIAKYDRIKARLNESGNEKLKELAESYVEAITEIKQIEEEIKGYKKNKQINMASAAEQDKLQPAKDKKDEISTKINEYIERYNKKTLRQLDAKEVFSVLNELNIVRDDSGKVDLDASIEQDKEEIKNKVSRNEELLNGVINRSYEQGTRLEGFGKYDRQPNVDGMVGGITEAEYRRIKTTEIQNNLEEKYSVGNKAKPVVYEKWYQKILHPFKSRNEKKAIEQAKKDYETEFQTQTARIQSDFMDMVEQNKRANTDRHNSMKVLSRSDYEEFAFGKDSKDVIDKIIGREMKEEENTL